MVEEILKGDASTTVFARWRMLQDVWMSGLGTPQCGVEAEAECRLQAVSAERVASLGHAAPPQVRFEADPDPRNQNGNGRHHGECFISPRLNPV